MNVASPEINPQLPLPEQTQDYKLQEGIGNLHTTLNDMSMNLQGMAQQQQFGAQEGVTPIDGVSQLEQSKVPASAEVSEAQTDEKPLPMPDPIPKVDPALLLKKSGYLLKCGGSNTKWRRRFFLLDIPTKPKASFKLYYFAKESDQVGFCSLSS